ncbi:hypothetical protein DSM107007_31610 [Nostoc sp. PCC 7120 = FACHB-418]|nr:hypothetical protein DSM107007_31610 [Nostoc sp. PCC 7120 = FACHB-418]
MAVEEKKGEEEEDSGEQGAGFEHEDFKRGGAQRLTRRLRGGVLCEGIDDFL